MRLPDLYYTSTVYDGFPEPPGQAAPIQFYIGEDIVFDIYLNYCNAPVLVSDWNIIVTVKAGLFNDNVVFTGELNNGLYENNTTGYYKIVIPSHITSTQLPGSYWMDITIQRKIGTGGVVDQKIVLLRQMFMLNTTVSGPNQLAVPNAAPEQSTPIVQPWLL